MLDLPTSCRGAALLLQLVMVLAHDSRLSSKIVHDEIILPINRQKTVFLYSGEKRLFFLLDSELQEHPLSVTVIPCSSSVQWSVRHRLENETGPLNTTQILADEVGRTLGAYQGKDLYSVKMDSASRGLYMIQVSSVETATYVNLYASMDPGGPYDLTIQQNAKMKLVPKRNRQLTVRWDPSLVNPQSTHYTLVVNTRRDYPTLCEAEGESPTIKPPAAPIYINFNAAMNQQRRMAEKSRSGRGSNRPADKAFHDALIIYVGKRTQLTLTRLELSQVYFFNLFATNVKSLLTIPYGNITFTYNFTMKPVLLKDGKPRSINLKKYEGRVHFKFKVSHRSKELHMYVIACGGMVQAELLEPGRLGKRRRNKRRLVLERKMVHGFQRFRITRPLMGRYTLRISAVDADELTRVSSVEVLATQYPAARFPVPDLPDDPMLYEYSSMKDCDRVTIGWIPTVDNRSTTYCVVVRENYNLDYEEMLRGNYQCHLQDAAMGKAIIHCQDMTSNSASVTTHTVTGLTPGRSYTIQVTVRRETSRALSYLPLKVFTKTVCD